MSEISTVNLVSSSKGTKVRAPDTTCIAAIQKNRVFLLILSLYGDLRTTLGHHREVASRVGFY